MAAKSKLVIAAFDFDETLILKDTLPDFLLHSFSLPRFLVGCIRALPMLIKFKTNKITNEQAKTRLLTIFLRGMPLTVFDKLCSDYLQRLNKITRGSMVEILQTHQKSKHKTIIISASPRNWILPWANEHGVDEVISTELEVVDGILTGKLSTPNCHGAEKVRRLKRAYPNLDAYKLVVYGDGKSDKELFNIADKHTVV